MTATAASFRCIPTSCSASTRTISRKFSAASRTRAGYELDTELFADDWAAMIERYKAHVQEEKGRALPAKSRTKQLWGAISAVFGSWMTPRAVTYRRLNGIPESWGTAVNVQAMVFGNQGDDCATGVAFTRNPSTGEKRLYGEFLINAQGEDVVAGIRTPQEITEAARAVGEIRQALDGKGDAEGLRRALAHLQQAREALPRHAGSRIHGGEGQALHAADALGQAHGEGGAPDRGRDGERKADLARRGRRAASIPRRSTSCCIPPSTRRRSAR